MPSLLYATGNMAKFRQAHTICAPAGIKLQQTDIVVDEIQSEDTERIARDKAQKVYVEL